MSTVLAIPITKKKRRRCVTTVAQIIISDVVVEDKIMCLLECSRAMKACVVDFTQCYSQEYLPSDIMSLLLWCHRDISCQKYLAYLVSKLRTRELNGKGTVHFASSCYIAACVVVVGCFKTSSS
jgi:hypothetical protein